MEARKEKIDIQCNIDRNISFFKNSHHRFSELSEKLPITDELWVISIARLPTTGHPEHALLIIEGQELSKGYIWFIDLIYNNKGKLENQQYIPLIQGQSKIRIYPYTGNIGEKLLYKCDKPLMKISDSNSIYFESWCIEKSIIDSLLSEVLEDRGNPPPFHLLGKGNCSTYMSSFADGHSCFTWAKEKLDKIGIKIKTDFVDEWVLTATHRYLKSGKEAKSSFYAKAKPYIIPLTVCGGTLFACGIYKFMSNISSSNLGDRELGIIADLIKPSISYTNIVRGAGI